MEENKMGMGAVEIQWWEGLGEEEREETASVMNNDNNF